MTRVGWWCSEVLLVDCWWLSMLSTNRPFWITVTLVALSIGVAVTLGRSFPTLPPWFVKRIGFLKRIGIGGEKREIVWHGAWVFAVLFVATGTVPASLFYSYYGTLLDRGLYRHYANEWTELRRDSEERRRLFALKEYQVEDGSRPMTGGAVREAGVGGRMLQHGWRSTLGYSAETDEMVRYLSEEIGAPGKGGLSERLLYKLRGEKVEGVGYSWMVWLLAGASERRTNWIYCVFDRCSRRGPEARPGGIAERVEMARCQGATEGEKPR